MSTPTRLANKTIWALEDILAASDDARQSWKKVMERCKRHMDPVMMAELAFLRDRLATIERKARLARRGEYDYAEEPSTDSGSGLDGGEGER